MAKHRESKVGVRGLAI